MSGKNQVSASCDADHSSRLATNGDEPQMAFSEEVHASKNGPDKNFIHQLRDLVGKVRFGWAVAVTVLGPIATFAGILIYTGWISIPAKESDMKVVQAKLASVEAAQSVQAEALKTLNVTMVRFEEGQKASIHLLDRIDGKLERIEEQHLAIMRAFMTTPDPQKASPAPSSPPPDRPNTQRKVKRKPVQPSGLSLFR
jgi:hypothetical protein